MSKTTFTLKRKLFTTFNGVSAADNPLPTAATSAFNQLPENFNEMSKQTQINTSMKAAKETMKNNSVATLNSTKPNVSTRFKQAGGWRKVGKIGLGVGAGALALGALGIFGAKKGISKAGEQSDGSKLFSQTKKKDNMATTYRLKRKTFSEGEGKKSNLGKLALGTAATAGLAFAGARRGMLGTGLQQSTNKLWASAGKTLGNQKMINSAAQKYGQARGSVATSQATANAAKKNITLSENQLKGISDRAATRGQNSILSKYKIPTE